MLTAHFEPTRGQGISIFQAYACHRLLKAVAPLTIAETPTAVLSNFTGTAWFLARDANVTLSNGAVVKQNVPTSMILLSATLTGTVPNATGGADTGRLHVLAIDTVTPIAVEENIAQ